MRRKVPRVAVTFLAMTVFWVFVLLWLSHATRMSLDRRKNGTTNLYESMELTSHLFMGGLETSQASKQRQRPIVKPSDFKGLKLLHAIDDEIYQFGRWDFAPIVIESHKLIFFTIPKVGCTIFKQLFRRMYGYRNWHVHNDYLPHHPGSNGLNYLYHYKPQEAEQMLTDPSWTRAIFFRDPKERLLSAYLDKVRHNHGHHVRTHCCKGNNHGFSSSVALQLTLLCNVPEHKLPDPLISFTDFLQKVVPHCPDPHWRPQANRMPDQFWPYVNFVGHMETIAQDTKALLEKVGGWEEYGATGWEHGAIFTGPSNVAHATNARDKLSEFFSSSDAVELAQLVHSADYKNPLISATQKVE